MPLSRQSLRFGRDQEYSGFFACQERAKPPVPGIVVIQEIWGVDAHIEEVTERFAAAGYGALAPDLFAKGGERPPAFERERIRELQEFMNPLPPTAFSDPAVREAALADRNPAEQERIRDSFTTITGVSASLDSFIPQVVAAARYLREECAMTRGAKVGSVGYCMGGTLSGRLAALDPELSGAVIYYGGAVPTALVPQVGCPVLGLYGSLDARVTGQVPAFED